MKEHPIIKLIKSSGIFLIGSVLSKVIVFFMLPLYTTYLPTEDYGLYDVYNSYVSLAVYALFFEVWTPVMRFMYDGKEARVKASAITNGTVIFAASSLVYALVTTAIFRQMQMEYYPLVILYGFAGCLSYMVSFIARGYEKNVDYAVSGILNTLVQVIANIVLIVALGVDYSALYIAYVAGTAAQVIYLELRVGCLRNVSFSLVDKRQIREMLIFALPLGINSLMYWGYTAYSRIVINNILSDAANGIYAISTRFSLVLSLVTTAVTYAWQQMSYAKEEEKKDNAGFYTKASALFLLALGLGLVLLFPAVRLVFPVLIRGDYAQALEIVPLPLISAAISAYSGLIAGIFSATKDTKPLFWSSMVSSVVNILICGPLVRRWGLNGASLAGVISYLITAGLRAYFLKRRMGMRFAWKIFALIALGGAVSVGIYYSFGLLGNALWLLLLSGGGGVFVYAKRKLFMGLLRKEG